MNTDEERLEEWRSGGVAEWRSGARGWGRDCEIEITVKEKDLAAACALIKQEMLRLNVPAGATLYYTLNGSQKTEAIGPVN